MTEKTTGDFWWVWREGTDWPSWFGSEKMARERVRTLAYEMPGYKVHLGILNVTETVVLPDKLVSA